MTIEEIRGKLIAAIHVERNYIEGFRAIAQTETVKMAIDMELIGIECAILAVRECEIVEDK